MSELDGRRIAELVHDFLGTDLGKHYMTQLSLMYNGLHQDAEKESLTPHEKASKVDRAAGLKLAIDFLAVRDGLLQQGHYEDKPVKE